MGGDAGHINVQNHSQSLKVKKNHLDERKDELTKADPARDWDRGPAQSPARSSPAQGRGTAAPR